jgi:diguanylate cyclase with GGDEF domain/signal transduction protein with periplasmic or extracellular sensor domain
MSLLHPKSIRTKLTAIILVTCGVSISLACAVLDQYNVVTSRRELPSALAQTADVMASSTTAALAFGDEQSATETLSSLKAEPHIVAACIYQRDGSVFATYQRTGSNAHSIPARPGPHETTATRENIILFGPAARRITTCVRAYDTVGRYGGEEFLVVVPSSDDHGVLALAERIRKTIESEPVRAEAAAVRVTASCGVAVGSADNPLEPTVLLQLADEARYRAKEKGRNRSEMAGEADLAGSRLSGPKATPSPSRSR